MSLKACPCCGGEADWENTVIEGVVWCLDCRLKITRPHSRDRDTGVPEAIAAWNTRVEEPKP